MINVTKMHTNAMNAEMTKIAERERNALVVHAMKLMRKNIKINKPAL
jgi:hypothetical protein